MVNSNICIKKNINIQLVDSSTWQLLSNVSATINIKQKEDYKIIDVTNNLRSCQMMQKINRPSYIMFNRSTDILIYRRTGYFADPRVASLIRFLRGKSKANMKKNVNFGFQT